MNPTHPLVSFVLLAYKQEAFIREAVEGAFSQTYSPLEIIISDDCSPDRTFDIIREMAAAYQGPHKVIINRNETNLGIGAHVEKAFRMARGEWIVAAAGDDISLPDRCRILMEAAEQESANYLGIASNWHSIDDAGRLITAKTAVDSFREQLQVNRHDTGLSGCRRALVDRTNQLSGCSAMWHRSLIHEWPRFICGLKWEDLTLSCRALLVGSIKMIDDQLLQYRTSLNALTNNQISDPLFSLEQRRQSEIKKLQENDALILAINQFFMDLEFSTSGAKTSRTKHSEITEIEKRLRQIELQNKWYESSMVNRLKAYLFGKCYPFESRSIFMIKHLVPASQVGPIQLTMERFSRWIKMRKNRKTRPSDLSLS